MKENLKKISKIGIFVVLLLFFHLFYVWAQDKPFEKDGKLDFNKPDAIANGLNNGEISVERLFKEKQNDAQIESVIGKVAKSIQSEILSVYSNTKVEVDGEISSFKDGKISTAKTNNFNLKDYNGFDGKISVNQDGSITITPNTNKPLKLDNNEIVAQRGNSIKVTGDAGSRTITALNLQKDQSISLKNSQSEVKLFQGSIKTLGNQFTLQEKSIAEYLDAVIKTQNTKVDLGFNSGKNSYVIFDKSKKEGFLFGRDYSVEFTKNSVYDKIGVDGSNIKVINGQLSFIFNNKEIMLQSTFGKGVKNMILTNMQSNHKVGIAQDGSFVGYRDSKSERVGLFNRYYWGIYVYDAVLETDIDRIKKDYQILKGDLPENLNENKEFQYFVNNNADSIKLTIISKREKTFTPDDIRKQVNEDIERSGVAYKKEAGGKLVILDKELQTQREIYENFLNEINQKIGIKVGSESISGIVNNKGYLAYYPNPNDRTIRLEKTFNNDRFMREVILPNWITEKNNVPTQPAELLKGFKK